MKALSHFVQKEKTKDPVESGKKKKEEEINSKSVLTEESRALESNATTGIVKTLLESVDSHSNSAED
jgi:hypothetical protein